MPKIILSTTHRTIKSVHWRAHLSIEMEMIMRQRHRFVLKLAEHLSICECAVQFSLVPSSSFVSFTRQWKERRAPERWNKTERLHLNTSHHITFCEVRKCASKWPGGDGCFCVFRTEINQLITRNLPTKHFASCTNANGDDIHFITTKTCEFTSFWPSHQRWWRRHCPWEKH